MDVEIYRNFLVVVSNGTISGAARQLNMTQPALSMQMKTLQNSIGQELLIKGQGSHSLILTSAGEIVYNKALKICQLEDKLQGELEERNEGLRGTLQLPILYWEDEWLVKGVIPAFHKKYPLVKFAVKRTNALTLQASSNQVDCRVMMRKDFAEYQDNYDVLFSGKLDVFVAVRQDSEWFNSETERVDFTSLENIPLAMSDNTDGKNVVNLMYHYGMTPEVLVWTNYRKGALKTAESGMAVAVVFSNADKMDYPELKFLPLEDPQLEYVYAIGKPKGMRLSPLLQKFVDFAIVYREEYGAEI